MYRAARYACPACRAELQATAAHWTCPGCGGTFVPEAELRDAIGRATGWVVEPHVDGAGWIRPPRTCPMCPDPMQQVTLAGRAALERPPAAVQLDRCAAHGVWFDTGELAAIAAHHRAPPGSPAPVDTTPPEKLTTVEWLLSLFGV